MNLLVDILRLIGQILLSYIISLWELIVGKPKKLISSSVVVITGAGHGLGREIAHNLIHHDVKLGLLDINGTNLEKVCQEIEQDFPGLKIARYVCDVSDERGFRDALQNIERDLGPVDILINNAGITNCAAITDVTQKDIQRVFSINVFSHFTSIQYVLPGMIERRRGHIVAIASVAGLLGGPNLVDYCSSKFAVVGLMDALREELDRAGQDFIKTTSICPLTISTGMFKSPRTRFEKIFPVCDAKYVADETVKAILEERKLVTVPRYMSTILASNSTMPERAVKYLRSFIDYGVEAHNKTS